MRMTSLEPTVFFVRDGDALRQLVRIGVDNDGTEREACLEVRAGGVREVLPLGAIAPGEGVYEVYLPDVRETTGVWLGLQVDGVLQDERETVWQPQKHWDVYLVHYSHHDLGYTGLPSHVLREHVGFLDDVSTSPPPRTTTSPASPGAWPACWPVRASGISAPASPPGITAWGSSGCIRAGTKPRSCR